MSFVMNRQSPCQAQGAKNAEVRQRPFDTFSETETMVDDTESFEEGANISEVVRRHKVVLPPLTCGDTECPDGRRAGTDRSSGAADWVAHFDIGWRPMPWPGSRFAERGCEYGAVCSPAMAFRAICSRTRKAKITRSPVQHPKPCPIPSGA